MLFSFGIRSRFAVLTKGVAIVAFLSSANFFSYSNSLSPARLSTSKGKDNINEYFAVRRKTGNGVNNNDIDLETMNKKSTEFFHVLDNETTAWHMGGSSNQRAERRDKGGLVITKFKNHKDQWTKETFSEWPSKCSTVDCNNVPTVGAHVVVDGKENVHLVPLCTNCNNDFSKNWIPDIKESSEIQSNNGFKLETGTPCLELDHISREESVASNNSFSWIEMYDRLVLHIEKYNTTTVSRRDKQLAEWTTYQRFRYKTLRTITSKEINLLEDIGFSWDPDGDSWNKKFALLKQYQEENGDCNAPRQYEENGANLGIWLTTQRQAKKKNKLHAKKESQLKDLGVIWEPLNDKWEENFKLLQQYKLKNGDCNVPKRYEENGIKLGNWLANQRTDRRNNKLINDKKEKLLDDLGVIWEPLIDQWEESFKLLQQYQEENGNCNVPQRHEESGVNLGTWLNTQRKDKKNNRLNAEREEQLEDLGVIWEPLIDKWEEHFEVLQQYKDINGDCNVPQRYEENGIKLGTWLHRQRTDKRNNKLNDEREKQLDDLGIIWEPLNDQWEKKYELLEQFKNERGHCNVSRSQKEDRKYRALRKWLSDQRSYYRKGNLENERQMKLDKLGVPFIDKWEEKYDLLEQFKDEKGHCNVSGGQKEDEKYRALGKWLAQQRFYYRNGNRRNERLMKLDKLGVEWNLKRKRKE